MVDSTIGHLLRERWKGGGRAWMKAEMLKQTSEIRYRQQAQSPNYRYSPGDFKALTAVAGSRFEKRLCALAFNLETCRLMISMLDRDMSGKMGFNEFKELGMVLNGWRQNFMAVDTNRSGAVDMMELQRSLTSMGYRLSPQALNVITRRYSNHGRIGFDDYITCCVKLRALTETFRRRDAAQQGMVNFMYDDFIQAIMSI
ncbi:sorcin-like [Mantella aurantiaca]